MQVRTVAYTGNGDPTNPRRIFSGGSGRAKCWLGGNIQPAVFDGGDMFGCKADTDPGLGETNSRGASGGSGHTVHDLDMGFDGPDLLIPVGSKWNQAGVDYWGVLILD